MKNKNGQEEIVGFVVIVLLVSIAAVIFIGLSAKKDNKTEISSDVEYFLGSAMEYTSECSKGYGSNYLKVSELVEECRSGSKCFSGEDSCYALNYTLDSLIGTGYKLNEANNAVKGYEFKAVYARNLTSGNLNENKIIEIRKGNCTGYDVKGADFIISSPPGSIISTLSVCG